MTFNHQELTFILITFNFTIFNSNYPPGFIHHALIVSREYKGYIFFFIQLLHDIQQVF